MLKHRTPVSFNIFKNLTFQTEAESLAPCLIVLFYLKLKCGISSTLWIQCIAKLTWCDLRTATQQGGLKPNSGTGTEKLPSDYSAPACESWSCHFNRMSVWELWTGFWQLHTIEWAAVPGEEAWTVSIRERRETQYQHFGKLAWLESLHCRVWDLTQQSQNPFVFPRASWFCFLNVMA